jgi:hypothetical protein
MLIWSLLPTTQPIHSLQMVIQFEQELHPLPNVCTQLQVPQVIITERQDMSKNGSDANLQPVLAMGWRIFENV